MKENCLQRSPEELGRAPAARNPHAPPFYPHIAARPNPSSSRLLLLPLLLHQVMAHFPKNSWTPCTQSKLWEMLLSELRCYWAHMLKSVVRIFFNCKCEAEKRNRKREWGRGEEKRDQAESSHHPRFQQCPTAPSSPWASQWGHPGVILLDEPPVYNPGCR